MERRNVRDWGFLVAWWIVVIGAGIMLNLGIKEDNGTYVLIAMMGFMMGIVISLMEIKSRSK